MGRHQLGACSSSCCFFHPHVWRCAPSALPTTLGSQHDHALQLGMHASATARGPRWSIACKLAVAQLRSCSFPVTGHINLVQNYYSPNPPGMLVCVVPGFVLM
eukprot:1157061-Pelagomonas_calceolata.AAC.2